MYVSHLVIEEFWKIINTSDVLKEDDINWPAPDRIGRQELELVVGNNHISFCTTKIAHWQILIY